jgi:hypothetical protein
MPLLYFVATEKFYFLNLGYQIKRNENKYLDLLNGANFTMFVKEEKTTKELELFIQIFENTSLDDIKKYWKSILKYQKILKENKKIGKRYYPLKKLGEAKEIFDLDKRKGMSDWEKQEEIYGEVGDLNFGAIECKRKNKLKQIRHQYKKRLKK